MTPAACGTICVAIPVKNGAAYLGEAIESVLAQAGVVLNVHVVDNGSEDDSVAIARSYTCDPRVQVDVNERDVQYYGSLNRVLAGTSAEYFVPFAADDVMRPDNLARKLEALERAGAGFAHSSADLIDEHGHVTDQWRPDHRSTPSVIGAPGFFQLLVPNNSVSCQSVLMRSSALRAIGGFDARSLYAGDWLTWMRLSLRWPVVTLPEALIANRVHAQAGTAASNRSGYNGRDVPATLDRVFLDPAMPAAWASLRDALVAQACTGVAVTLHNTGIRRVTDGWAGYMAMGHALRRTPHDSGALERYLALVRAADLVAPAAPVQAVAEPPRDEEDARALGATVEELGDLIDRVLIAALPDQLDQAVELLQPVFGTAAVEVELMGSPEPFSLLVPGRLALARWGSQFVAAAEELGVPVYPYRAPDPFAEPPDMTRWQTVDRTACLP